MSASRPLPFKVGQFARGRGLGRAIKAADKRKLVEGLATLQHGRLVAAFEHGGHHRHGGQPWVPLKPATVIRKARAKKGKILVWSGRLRNSIRTNVKGRGANTTAEIIADAPYAKFHQFGTRRMPGRPVIVITEQDRREMVKFATRFFDRLLNGQANNQRR